MNLHRLPDGRELRYDLRLGDRPDGPPVVFLNGLSQTTVAWGLQARRLRPTRGVLLYDASGQGRSSPPPEGWRPEQHAGDLLDLLKELELERVDLVGFSFGSRIALRLALREPWRVRRMVLIGCAHRETALRRWIVTGWLRALEAGGLEHCFEIVTPSIVGDAWLAKNEHMREQMLRAFRRRNDPESMRRLLEDTLLPGGDLGEELRNIEHSVLVCRGEFDIVVPRVLNDELVSWLPNSRYAECAAAGHTVGVENANWTAERLHEHLLS